jgi:hypothetical protein
MPDEKVLKTPRGLQQSVRRAPKQIITSLVDTAVRLGIDDQTDPERLARQAVTLTKPLRDALALAESLSPSAEKAEQASSRPIPGAAASRWTWHPAAPAPRIRPPPRKPRLPLSLAPPRPPTSLQPPHRSPKAGPTNGRSVASSCTTRSWRRRPAGSIPSSWGLNVLASPACARRAQVFQR